MQNYHTSKPVGLWDWIRFALLVKSPVRLFGENGLIEWGRYAHGGDKGDIRRAYHWDIFWNWESRRRSREWVYYDHPFRVFNLWAIQVMWYSASASKRYYASGEHNPVDNLVPPVGME